VGEGGKDAGFGAVAGGFYSVCSGVNRGHRGKSISGPALCAASPPIFGNSDHLCSKRFIALRMAFSEPCRASSALATAC
jgi:hypothetical protein